jgi:predicted amidohydrolase
VIEGIEPSTTTDETPVARCLLPVASPIASLRIALVQMRSEKGDLAGNLVRIREQVADAARHGAEIVAFPEMSLTGYIDPARWPDAILDLDSPAVDDLAALTAGSRMTLIAGIVERNPAGKPFITQVVAQGGTLAGFYRKITVVDEEADWFSPVEGVPIFRHRGVPFGVAICADIDNPAVFASAAEQGARIIFECAAPGLYGEQATRDWRAGYDWWRGECATKLGGYARKHGVSIAVATQAGRTIDEDFPGGGYLFGPDGADLAATPDWSEGMLIIDAPLAQ